MKGEIISSQKNIGAFVKPRFEVMREDLGRVTWLRMDINIDMNSRL